MPDGQMMQPTDNVNKQRARWEEPHGAARSYCFKDSVLEPVGDFKPSDPFLSVSVDKQIMEDHNDIANPRLVQFIGEYIQFCQTDEQSQAK